MTMRFIECLSSLAVFFTVASTEEFLLVSSRGHGIHKVGLASGTKTHLPLPHSTEPFGVTYDASMARVLWYDYVAKRVASAQFDGSDYTVLQNTSGLYRYIRYDGIENKLFYNNEGSISFIALGSNVKEMTMISNINVDGQLAVDLNRRTTYFIKADNSIASIRTDGTGLKTLYYVPSGIHMHDMWGLVLHKADNMLYSCGFRLGGSPYVCYLYKYNFDTGTSTLVGTRNNFPCYRLVTDGRYLFIGAIYSGQSLKMPLNGDITTAIEVDAGHESYVFDFEYVNTTLDCVKAGRSRSYRERIPETAAGGDLVASFPISPRLRCKLTGDKDAVATFDAATRNASCQVFLKAGRQLNQKMKRNFNIKFELSGSCPWTTPDVASLVLEVYPGAGCQALPESSPPGTVALEVPITYPGQPMPLRVVLHEDTRGQPQQFVVKSPITRNSTNGTVTATAQVVLRTSVDLEKRGSRLHSFSLQLDYCVEVTDANDNTPEFLFPDGKRSSLITWKEGTKGYVATAKARDSDEGEFGTAGLRFFIAHDPSGGFFSIDPKTGAISVTKELDKDSSLDHIPLVIEARDNEGMAPYNKALTVLQVKLLDVNDNKPRFSQTKYKTDILEVMFDGNVVIKVTATDADEGENGEVVYSMTSTNPLPFVIEPDTGRIKVSGKLMGRVGTYHLSVTATDRGTPSLSSSAAVVINVRGIRSLPGRKRRDALLLARAAAN